MKTELVFELKVDGKTTYEGKMTVPDDDGTCTLPMMVNSIVREVADKHPQFHKAKSIQLVARLLAGKSRSRISNAQHHG